MTNFIRNLIGVTSNSITNSRSDDPVGNEYTYQAVRQPEPNPIVPPKPKATFINIQRELSAESIKTPIISEVATPTAPPPPYNDIIATFPDMRLPSYMSQNEYAPQYFREPRTSASPFESIGAMDEKVTVQPFLEEPLLYNTWKANRKRLVNVLNPETGVMKVESVPADNFTNNGGIMISNNNAVNLNLNGKDDVAVEDQTEEKYECMKKYFYALFCSFSCLLCISILCVLIFSML